MNKRMMMALSVGLMLASVAQASQEDFFRGLSGQGDSGTGSSGSLVDVTMFLAVLGLIAGALVLLVWIVRLRKTLAVRAKHNPARLVRELARKVNLKPTQLKKLKPMAAKAEVSHPLILLLCPSIVAGLMKKNKQQ